MFPSAEDSFHEVHGIQGSCPGSIRSSRGVVPPLDCCGPRGVGRNVLLQNLLPLVGQFPYRSPSVFNYYLPGFKPADFPPGMVGPEFQIFTPPMAISFTNGLNSLIELGLGPCSGGFGFDAPQNCSNGQVHLGELECLQPTIDQLDLLLTGGETQG